MCYVYFRIRGNNSNTFLVTVHSWLCFFLLVFGDEYLICKHLFYYLSVKLIQRNKSNLIIQGGIFLKQIEIDHEIQNKVLMQLTSYSEYFFNISVCRFFNLYCAYIFLGIHKSRYINFIASVTISL